MEKGLKNLTQAYRQAQRKQGTYEINHDDSGVGISDLDEDPNENPSPVLTDASNHLPMVYQQQQQPTTYQHHQNRVPSIHSILQHPPHLTMLQQQTMGQQTMGQQTMGYTSAYHAQH